MFNLKMPSFFAHFCVFCKCNRERERASESDSNSKAAHNDHGVRRDNDDEVHKVQDAARRAKYQKIQEKKNKQIVNKFSAPAPLVNGAWQLQLREQLRNSNVSNNLSRTLSVVVVVVVDAVAALVAAFVVVVVAVT